MAAITGPSAQEWHSLAMPREELCLAFTLPTGQSFRWRKTGKDMYTGVVHQRVVRYWLCIAPRKASCPVLPQSAASQVLSTENASTRMTRVETADQSSAGHRSDVPE